MRPGVVASLRPTAASARPPRPAGALPRLPSGSVSARASTRQRVRGSAGLRAAAGCAAGRRMRQEGRHSDTKASWCVPARPNASSCVPAPPGRTHDSPFVRDPRTLLPSRGPSPAEGESWSHETPLTGSDSPFSWTVPREGRITDHRTPPDPENPDRPRAHPPVGALLETEHGRSRRSAAAGRAEAGQRSRRWTRRTRSPAGRVSAAAPPRPAAPCARRRRRGRRRRP